MTANEKYRHGCALAVILAMVAAAEILGEREIVFPELSALLIGLWIIDKRVWTVRPRQVVALLTLGAAAGVCLVRYSPLPPAVDIGLAFAFAGACLLAGRATLVPLVSACMLPVMLHTESWVYPAAVFVMASILVAGQYLMVRSGLRRPIDYVPVPAATKGTWMRWGMLLGFVVPIAACAEWMDASYVLLPPLVVTFVEMVNSDAGFRNRPVQVCMYLTGAAAWGTLVQYAGGWYLHLPATLLAGVIATGMFVLFRSTGKYFAPAAAMSFIPLIVPEEGLLRLPAQAALGAVVFAAIALVVFQRCYRWSRARLVYCLAPSFVRIYMERRK